MSFIGIKPYWFLMPVQVRAMEMNIVHESKQ